MGCLTALQLSMVKREALSLIILADAVVEQANISAGLSVLDVATGKGAVLFPIAESIGPCGKAIRIDISQIMLDEVAKEANKINWIDLDDMDAEHLCYPDGSFDAVFCGFGLFFFPSAPKALSEFKRVMKTGGKLAVSTWGKESDRKLGW